MEQKWTQRSAASSGCLTTVTATGSAEGGNTMPLPLRHLMTRFPVWSGVCLVGPQGEVEGSLKWYSYEREKETVKLK